MRIIHRVAGDEPITVTGLRWPRRWHRSSACRSICGLKSQSWMITVSAEVRFKPCPPARVERRNANAVESASLYASADGLPLLRRRRAVQTHEREPRVSQRHFEYIKHDLPLRKNQRAASLGSHIREQRQKRARFAALRKRLRRQTQITQLPARRGVAAQVVQIHVRVRVVEHVRPDAVQARFVPEHAALVAHARCAPGQPPSTARAREAGGWRFCAAERRAVASFSLRRRTFRRLAGRVMNDDWSSFDA